MKGRDWESSEDSLLDWGVLKSSVSVKKRNINSSGITEKRHFELGKKGKWVLDLFLGLVEPNCNHSVAGYCE